MSLDGWVELAIFRDLALSAANIRGILTNSAPSDLLAFPAKHSFVVRNGAAYEEMLYHKPF